MNALTFKKYKEYNYTKCNKLLYTFEVNHLKICFSLNTSVRLIEYYFFSNSKKNGIKKCLSKMKNKFNKFLFICNTSMIYFELIKVVETAQTTFTETKTHYNAGDVAICLSRND